MAKRDYYEILGIERSADDGTIKSAYRKMAMQFHPDRNPGDSSAEEKFKEATEAYEILKDPHKRQAYDQFGHAGVGQGAGGGGFGFQGFDIGDALRAFMRDFGGGGSIFEEFFGGGGGGRRRRHRGEDLRVRLKLTLEEIAVGVERKIKVNRLVHCDTCAGSGVAAGASKQTCPQCRGTGQMRTVARTLFGTMQQLTFCSNCNGTGEVISEPCATCHGEGRVRGSSEVTVRVPPGVSSGNYLTVDNMGNVAPQRGQAGDLVVVFEEEEHEHFSRHGDHVVYELPISFPQAALGAEVTVPTLNGEGNLKIPPGTQSGKILKLRGKGIPHLRGGGRGDQLVHVVVWVPTKIGGDDRDLLERLEQSETFKAPRGSKSFFSKLRETLGV